MITGGKRRKYSSEEKVRILHRHLVDRVPESDLCDEHRLHLTVFHRWQRTLIENETAAFERRDDGRTRKLEKENAGLKAKLAQKDEGNSFLCGCPEPRTPVADDEL